MDVVRKLLEDGADIQEKGGLDDTTPLHQAARYGREQITQLLIEHETDVSNHVLDTLGGIFQQSAVCSGVTPPVAFADACKQGPRGSGAPAD